MLEVLMPHPERFWLAARSDVVLASDPDVEDGRQRWPDRDTIDWARIAAIVADAGVRIARQQLGVDEDGDQMLVVDDNGLSGTERKVVASWFRGGQVPSSDPGRDGVEDGRHRLWNAWKHAPDVVLPIHSDVLHYVDDIAEMPQLEAITAAEAGRVLKEVGAGVAFRSPHYVRELQRWAATEH